MVNLIENMLRKKTVKKETVSGSTLTRESSFHYKKGNDRLVCIQKISALENSPTDLFEWVPVGFNFDFNFDMKFGSGSETQKAHQCIR